MIEPRLPAWWLEQALEAEGSPEPSAGPAGDAHADVIVVGGGYTGLWTALALRERDPSLGVTVVEAELCGSGPSGRNGGFVHGYWAAMGSVLPVLGEAEAERLCIAGDRVIPAIRDLGEDVWLHEGGRMIVSASPAQDAVVDRAIAATDRAVPLSREELAQRIVSPVFRRGVFFEDGATVHPGLLVRALRRKAIAAGVTVHERTPALRVREGEVTTRAGVLRAPEIVLATNAFLTGWRPAARSLTNFGSYVVLTEPVPELIEQIRWTGNEAITDGRMFVDYFRTLDDGRVLMGSGSGPIGFAGKVDERFSRDRPTAARAERALRRLLPGLDEAKIERAWGGPIDVSADHLPFFKTKPGTRIHYGAGYSGHGVGPSWLGGQILASLATRADDEWSRNPLATRQVPSLPPEPFRRLGGGLVRKSIMACEVAEEEERRPPLAARAGAAIPRLLGMELGTR